MLTTSNNEKQKKLINIFKVIINKTHKKKRKAKIF